MAAILDDRLRHTSYEYAAGLRVPSGNRRREIDLVVTTPDEIWVVELKNWSGFVGLDGQNVVQHRSQGRGVVDHGRLLSDMRHKQRILEKYLSRSLDKVPELWSVLVFCNDNATIDDALVSRDDMDVVGLREFLGALPSAAGKQGGPVATESIQQAREVLARLGTWDLLVLHGGQILSGDLIDISVPELGDRDRFGRLDMGVPRSLFKVLQADLRIAVTAVERDGDKVEISTGFDESLRFHAAGQPKPQEFALRDVEVLSLGYTTAARES